jgi:hypothetical protein
MATRVDARVDSGNIQLRQPGGVPMRQIEPRPVQYFAGKVQAEYGQAMGQMLDRMSAGLFEYAGKLRSEEGLKWAAENQITEQQLEDITGGKPGESVNIGAGNIVEQGKVIKSLASMLPSKFNEAVMKFRSAELSYKLEQQAISKMSTMLEGIDRGPGSTVSSKNIIQEINTITNAHYQVLAGVDPAAANRYNATMATHGNAVYKAALKAEAEYNKRTRTTKFFENYDKEIVLLDRQIQENPTNIKSIYEAGLARLKEAVFHEGIGFETGGKYIDDYQKKYINGKIDVLSKHYMSGTGSTDDVYGTLLKIQKRDAGNYSSLLAGMDTESVEKITANVMTAYTQREQVKNNKRDQDKRNGEAAAIDLLEKIYPIKDVKNPKRVAYVNELMALPPGSLPIGEIKNLLEPEKEGDGNPVAEYNALGMIFDGRITTKEQLDKIPGLNPRQRLGLLKSLRTEDKDGLRALDAGLNKLAGIASEPGAIVVIDQKSEEWKRKQQLKVRVAEIQSEAANEGKVLTERQIIDKMEKEILDRRNSTEAKQAKESLDNFTVDRAGKAKPDRDWITGPVNKQTLPALKEKAKGDPKKLRQIQEIERLLKVSEGN